MTECFVLMSFLTVFQRVSNIIPIIILSLYFQMIQAIQVLRFHLLELEKVTTVHPCVSLSPSIHPVLFGLTSYNNPDQLLIYIYF